MTCNWRAIFQCTTVRSYADHMPNYSDLTSGYSRPILIPHSAKRVLDCRQNHNGCRQNKLRLLCHALLITPYVSEHYKHMFLVARDLYEMLVLSRGKHTSRRSTVGIWSEVRVYRTPATNIPWAGVLRLGKFPDKRRVKDLLPITAYCCNRWCGSCWINHILRFQHVPHTKGEQGFARAPRQSTQQQTAYRELMQQQNAQTEYPHTNWELKDEVVWVSVIA